MKYKDEDLTEWLSGKPEHVGEYNACIDGKSKISLRWWNGEEWSASYHDSFPQSDKNRFASIPMWEAKYIKYRGLKVKP